MYTDDNPAPKLLLLCRAANFLKDNDFDSTVQSKSEHSKLVSKYQLSKKRKHNNHQKDKCYVCKKLFSRKRTKARHARIHKGLGCRECSIIFISYSDYEDHIRLEHN